MKEGLFGRWAALAMHAIGASSKSTDATAALSPATLKNQAENGDPAAQAALGMKYELGLSGFPQDFAKASAWYLKAAEQGNAMAQLNIGIAYDQGQGVPQDYAQAAFWWRKAAEQGIGQAQSNLGVLYFNGQGVPQDNAQAAFWYRKAADQCDADAQHNLGLLYYAGKGVPQDYAQAAAWLRKAAEQGHAPSQMRLGILYDQGQGVPQDYALAAEWYRKAADQGQADAQIMLTRLREENGNNDQGVPQDDALDTERPGKGAGRSLTDQPETSGRIKESVDASFLADELLQYAFSPASEEQLQKLSHQYLDELLFLKLFSVDYILGSMSATHSGLTIVRMLYNNGIESYCSDKGFDYPTIAERFEIYTRACNAYLDYEPEKRERLGPYWELGKEFSRLASEVDPWVPNAIEVAVHGNCFASACLRLSTFLAQYEISISTR
jgi:TPR repeat protein